MRKKPVPNPRAPAKTKPASQKRSREQPLPPPESQAATTGVTAAGPRATIRVYRHGLGDCILIQLKRAGGKSRIPSSGDRAGDLCLWNADASAAQGLEAA